MKNVILSLAFSVCYYFASAQSAQKCGFETLFTIKPGMDKASVMVLVNSNYKVTPKKQIIEKLPPYAKTGGDSIVREVVTYHIDSSACFQGHNRKFQLEFADNKLYKVYISTVYFKSEFQAMINNFNELHNTIKPKWPFEKETKISGGNIVGFGFDYSKTEKMTTKTEKVSLQYVDDKADNPASGTYLLEVLWVNLGNTRMENSTY